MVDQLLLSLLRLIYMAFFLCAILPSFFFPMISDGSLDRSVEWCKEVRWPTAELYSDLFSPEEAVSIGALKNYLELMYFAWTRSK